ncbi:MAG: hypothetical protein O7H41_14595 [Planctomycetota bacterium]|nr:hypothetical protein [Planctomycetota bacterium]
MRLGKHPGSRMGPQKICLLAATVLLLAGSGCGYIAAVAIAVASSSGGSSGGDPSPEVPPLLVLDPILRQDGNVLITYTLQDANSDLVDIVVDFSPDDITPFGPATDAGPGAGSEGTAMLTADPTGITHTFVWDSTTDIGTSANQLVRIQITPTDAKGMTGMPVIETNVFVGNDAPMLQNVRMVPDSSNLVAVTYDLLDSTSDAGNIAVLYSLDGGLTFPSQATVTGGGVANLPTDPAGITHTLAWDALNDLGLNNFDMVVLQLTPSDDPTGQGPDIGTAVDTNIFAVTNNDSPSAFIEAVQRQDDLIQINFFLVDSQNDLIAVEFEYSLDMGGSWATMSLTPTSVVIDLLPTTITGVPHPVFWQSLLDIGVVAAIVRVRVRPSDAGGMGAWFETGDFVVGNDAPSVVLEPITGLHDEGIITITFTLTDTTNDPSDLNVEYSTDSGLVFFPATIEVGVTVNAPPSPLMQKLSWNSILDLPNADFPTVRIRMRACDDEIGIQECGSFSETIDFRVVNIDRPVGFIASPSPAQVVEGNVIVSYLLFENSSLDLDATMEFSTDNGATFAAATANPIPPHEALTVLSSSPGGTRHDFVWDTIVDLPGVDYSSVKLLVTPIDAAGPGTARAMDGPFFVNNNQEPEAFVGTPPSPQDLGFVAINYSLQDLELTDLVEIVADFSTDGGATFGPATDAGPGQGSEGTIGLSAGVPPTPHVFVWDSIIDVVALDLKEDDVIFRITPSDNANPLLGLGSVSQTILFSVDNTSPPSVTIAPVPNQSSNIDINYTLFDDEMAPIDILVEFSTDVGANWSLAKECTTCGTSDGVTGLTSDPAGVAHVFTWESDFDIGPALVTGVLIQITPSDTKLGTADTSGAFEVQNNVPPIALIQTPSGIPSGDVVISYTLSDNNDDVSSITPEFSTDAGVSFQLATEQPGLPSEGTTGLITSGAGVNHVFVWNSSAIADLGLGFEPNVRFRVTPMDSSVGAPADTADFPVNNQNLLPVARIDPIARSLSSDVTITYFLSDGDLDLSDILVEYSIDGGATFSPTPATERTGGASEGISGLTTTQTGTSHTFVWDSAADLLAGAQSNLEIRITPTDGDGTGFSGVSNVFIVGNDAPMATITSPLPLTTQSGLIEFVFTLSDSTTDPVDITPRYSTDAGVTFLPATIAVGGLTSLFAPPGGQSHDFAWNSVIDLGDANLTGVQFEITPIDSIGEMGAPALVTIDINNNNVPISFIGSPAVDDLKSGDIQVSHILIDVDSDAIDITVEYTVDGIIFLSATENPAPPSEGITGLTSSPDGISHIFVWDSATNFTSQDSDQVRIRITPSDPVNVGTPFTSEIFLVNNNLEPSSAISTPTSPQDDLVTVNYTLSDTESDLVDVSILFSTDGGQTFAPATELPGPPSEGITGLTASPAGNPHVFVWDTVLDGVAISLAENDVILRVVPQDNTNPTLGLGTLAQTDIFTVDNTTVPSVVVVDPPSPQTGDPVIDYTLTDVESALQTIVVEYSTDGSNYFPAKECTTCTAPVSDGVTNLTSSPGGTTHVFRWEASTDLGPARTTGVTIRITTMDTKTSPPDVTLAFEVDNNDPPSAFVTTPPGSPSGDIVVSYALTDTHSDMATIMADYSTDGGLNFFMATERPGLPSEGLGPHITSTGGINHIFVWDSVADVGFGFFPSVVFRITPLDTSMGIPSDSGVFSVSNQTFIPGVALDPIARSFVDDVTMTYRLFDGDSDAVDILVEWRQGGSPNPWMLATDAGPGAGSDGVTGLSSDPTGAPHTFVWDTFADLLTSLVAEPDLEIRITPTDPDGTGNTEVSNVFIRGNDAPVLTITDPAPLSIQSGLIEFTYDLVDSTSDLVDLVAEYSTDGVIFLPASISVGETADITSAPTPGLSHDLAWNSIADLGIVNLTGVTFRLTPSDTTGGLDSDVVIDIDNNDLPISFIGAPAISDLEAGDVQVSHILIDGNSDPIDIMVEYSTDGATYLTATENPIPPSEGITGLTSSPDGVEHIFLWDSAANLASLDSDTATLRITPDDGKNPGVVFTTADFLVNNNVEPTATISTPSGSQDLDITINYVLFDAESDAVDIDVFYSTDGSNFFSATEQTGPPSEGVTGLSASPAGDPHVFVWDTSMLSGDDVGRLLEETAVLFRIVPRDNPNLTLGLGTRAQTDFFTVDNTVPPGITIDPIASPGVGNITITYSLRDTESELQNILVEFDTGSGPLPATEGPGSDGTTGLTASPAGIAHTFVWDSFADLGPAFVQMVTITITPSDTKIGTADTSNLFDVDNNDAPVATIDTPLGQQAGDIVISYSLSDSNSDPADITVRYSTDGGSNWAAATEGGPPSQGVTALTTSTGGITHLFVWDSITDVAYAGPFNMTRIEITPADSDVGLAVATTNFRLNNPSLLPLADIAPVPRSFTDDVTINYRLFDGDADDSDIAVDWSTDNGVMFVTATEGVGGDGKMGLPAGPGGVAHTFVWDSATDLGAAAAVVDILIRITPTDNDGLGTEDTSNKFIRGNDAPSVTITAPPAGSSRSGLIRIGFNLTDSTSDLVNVAARFSTDAGGTFTVATIQVGGRLDLTSSPTGISHSFAWNSIADVGIVNLVDVIFELTPSDTDTGGVQTVTFDVDNNDLPIVFIGSPASADERADDVDIEYVLIDGNSDTISITVEYSTGGIFSVATEGPNPPSEGLTLLTSSPDGIGHLFVWDSRFDLGANDSDTVTFRITPDDGQNTGVAFTTPDFLVNNNDEPEVTSIDPLGPGAETGLITIDYVLADAESDNTNLRVEYSTDGGFVFATATGGAGSDGILGLTTSPGGTTHVFVWDSDVDLAGILETTVVVRISPSDNANPTLGAGPPNQTTVFEVDNTSPPSVTISMITSPSSGDITVNYTLTDAESDLQDIVVEYDVGGGPVPATEGAGSDGVTGLTSSPGGTAHVFVWESVTDLGRDFVPNVTITITPMDTKLGIPDTSNMFDVDNNQAPVVQIFNISGVQSGDVYVSYRIRDSFSHLVDLVIEYSIGGGTPVTATESTAPPAEGKVMLTSGPLGEEVGHLFIWDTFADLSSTISTDVEIQITPTDQHGAVGALAASNPFSVDNSISAELVLGHDSFLQGGVDGRGIDPEELEKGTSRGDADIGGSQLFVSDPANHRVLIFDSVPGSDFQTADVVVGQKDFSVNVENFQGPSASSLNNPMGVYSDGTGLYVCDTDNHRVLIWDAIPTSNNVPADHVLGQLNFMDNMPDMGGGPDQDTLDTPLGIYGDADQIFVSDANNHRIMIWNIPAGTPPAWTDGQMADHVLGQANFTSEMANRGGGTNGNTLNSPRGIFTDGTTLIVADTTNHRVLWWTIPGGTPPAWADGQAADGLLGKAAFTSPAIPNGDFNPTACAGDGNSAGRSRRSLNFPQDVFLDTGHTYIADGGNHRVVILNQNPPPSTDITFDDGCADAVLGQINGRQGIANSGGLSSTSLRLPLGVASTGTELLVFDHDNSRVKIHDTIPTGDNDPAQIVYGQRNFTSNFPNHARIDPRSFRRPGGVDSDGSQLFVADSRNNRVLVWSTIPNVNNKNADLVLGQSDFSSILPAGGTKGHRNPTDVAYDTGGDRLFVADSANNRVTVYNGPFNTDMDQSIWLGQPDSVGVGAGLAANRMDDPAGLSWQSSGGGFLWVVDRGNHRVLRFSDANIVTNGSADIAVGQPNLVSGSPDHGNNDGTRGLRNPNDVVSNGTQLLVVDRDNHRVMIWDPLPDPLVDMDPAVSLVLGQADTTIPGVAATSVTGMSRPLGVESDTAGIETVVMVTDGDNNRIMIWDQFPVASGEAADRLIGQPSFDDSLPNNGGVSEVSLFIGKGILSENCSLSLVPGAADLLWVNDQRNNRVLRYDVTP